jgi:Protein of unknown function (DUF3999)
MMPLKKLCLICALHALCISQAFALSRDDFALEVPVQVPDAKPLVAVDLPEVIYLASRKAGLADLRVVNSAGEAVPYAIGLAPLLAPQTSQTQLEVLPFYTKANEDAAGVGVTLTVIGDQTRLVLDPKSAKKTGDQMPTAYYLDLGVKPQDKLKASIQFVDLSLLPGADLTTSLRLEGSDDLKQWRTLVNAAPIFRLNRAGQALSNTRIDVASPAVRYLRITALSAALLPGISQAAITWSSNASSARAIEWLTLKGTSVPAPEKNAFVYDAGAMFPFQRFNVVFEDANTLAPLKLLARMENTAQSAWETQQSATLYRMNLGATEVRSADTLLPSNANKYRYWRLEIDERAGEFSKRAPQLRLGFYPARVVFTARGSPPFSLLVGNAQVEAVALSMESLIPGQAQGEALDVSKASLNLQQLVRRDGKGPKQIDRSGEQRKQWTLWAILLLGVGGLTVFALKLLKPSASRAQ